MSKGVSRRVRKTLAMLVAGIGMGAVATTSAQAPSGADDHAHHQHAMPQAPQPATQAVTQPVTQPAGQHDHQAMQHAPAPAVAQDHAAMQHAPEPMAGHDAQGHEGHEQHAEMMKQDGYIRVEAAYDVPNVVLTDQNGRRVAVRDALGGPKPVMLNFIYTTCTTICPVLSATFAQTQRALGPDARDVRLVSVSIDPEHDTPERLRDYAQRFQAAEGWQLLTGRLEDVIAVQQAFDAFRGSKANHIPLALLRVAPEGPWVRMQGFASANELVQEYRQLVSAASPAHQHGGPAH